VNAMRVFAKLKDGGVLGGNVTINAKQQEWRVDCECL
jgi:hypothetical protein